MKPFYKSIVLICFVIFNQFSAQVSTREKWINGFGVYLAGENLSYHSCHPEANLSLLIRCLNSKDFIEWETDTIPKGHNNDEVTFVWIGGYSTGTSSSSHTFKLALNDKHLLSFTTHPKSEIKDWIVKENGAELSFKFGRIDQHNDFFGYFSLTVPKEMLNGNSTGKLKVQGDASGSRDWYMTMQYKVVPKIRITPEKIISKGEEGKIFQRVKVSIDHFDLPKLVLITSLGSNQISSELGIGMNNYFLNYEASQNTLVKIINISLEGQSSTHEIKITPAKKITFYLNPHGHVDIGYTELQTEVEKKHWLNFENAIVYSKRSQNYKAGSLFKWNVEVLWAVKSYLEKFPEKKKDFYEAVRKGWIGLDATYANVQTALCRPEELYRLLDYSNQLEKEIGIKIESAMISDIPGYTWGVVQAFADNGVKYFSVGTNEFDRIGNTLKTWGDKPFYWQSPSGQNQIMIWLAGKGYSWFHGWRLTRDDLAPIAKYLDQLDEENYPYDIVHTRYNIGGDNGYPDSTLSEFVKNWNETHETPKFKIATTAEMFSDFERKYENIIPTYSGDFTPYWEDGAGSTAKETALNRRTAEKLVQLEKLYTLRDYKNFPHNQFDEAWKNVLLFSEHTWGAYNSVSDPELKFVTDQWEIKKSFALKADSLASNLEKQITFETHTSVSKFEVYNSLSWHRSDVVKLKASIKYSGKSLVDEEGEKVTLQKLTSGNFVFIAKNIPPLGFRSYKFVDDLEDTTVLSKQIGFMLENNSFQVVLNKSTGAISELRQRISGFNYVDSKSKYLLNQFIHAGQNAENPKTSSSASIHKKENGSVLNSIIIQSIAEGCNSLSQEIKLYNGLDKIEVINTIDKKKNYEKENLRFAFPFNIVNAETKIDLAWSVIRPEADQLKGANRNYYTAQRWFDVSNKDYGITVATVDAPFLEVGGMNAEGWMSAPNKEWISKTQSSNLILSWVMNNSWHTNFKASQEGVVSFNYVIRPHNGFNYFEAYKLGVESAQSLIPVFTNPDTELNKLSIKIKESSAIVITSIKPARNKNAIVIRLFNPTNEKATFEFLELNKYVLFLSDGDEVKLRKLQSIIEMNPFEVKTIVMGLD